NARVAQRDRAARALFAATEIVSANKFETEYGRSVPMKKYAEYAGRYRAQFLAQVRQINPAKTAGAEVRDAWQTGLRIERTTWNPPRNMYFIKSAGPDKRFDTWDDLAAYAEVRSAKIAGPPGTSTIGLTIEQERGPFNGLAAIAGSVVDQSGAAIGGATIQAREVATGKTRSTKADAAGQFSLPAIPAGDYQVQVSSSEFGVASTKRTLDV